MNALALDCWKRVCRLCNVMSLASSLLAFQEHGQSLDGNSGYLGGFLRCLDSLGWRTPDEGWTVRAQPFLDNWKQLRRVPELLETAACWLDGEETDWPEIQPSPLEEILEACLLAPLLVLPQDQTPTRARPLLEKYGWLGADGQLARLQGHVFHYPLAYLETLRRADQLLYGDFRALRSRDPLGREAHVDRKRDIHFSGKVFSGSVAAPLLELFRPAASAARVLVDVGCGDGLMLAELGRLAPHLRLVGVEYNPVARQVAAQRLPEALMLDGDIGEPERLMDDLDKQGVDWRESLFVTKSVIHNRPYKRPARSRPGARTTAVAADGDGRLISPGDLEGSLVEFFQSWKPFLGHHGFLAVEAHTVAPAVARRHLDRSLAPCLDLTHCYSNQLLIEAEVYRDCARQAGIGSRAQRELGAAAFGHDHMTIDHFRQIR